MTNFSVGTIIKQTHGQVQYEILICHREDCIVRSSKQTPEEFSVTYKILEKYIEDGKGYVDAELSPSRLSCVEEE